MPVPIARDAGKVRLRVLAKLGVPGYQPYERLGLWLRRELRPVVERLLLSDRCLGRGIFEPRRPSRRSSVSTPSGQRTTPILLMALMIFEQGQREFVDRRKSAPGRPGQPAPLPSPGTGP